MMHGMLSVFYSSNLEKFSWIYSVGKCSHFHVLISSASHHQSWETIISSLPMALFVLSAKGPSLYSCPQKARAHILPHARLVRQLLPAPKYFITCCVLHLCILRPSTEITQIRYFHRLVLLEKSGFKET